jgi:hypothetical protein
MKCLRHISINFPETLVIEPVSWQAVVLFSFLQPPDFKTIGGGGHNFYIVFLITIAQSGPTSSVYCSWNVECAAVEAAQHCKIHSCRLHAGQHLVRYSLLIKREKFCSLITWIRNNHYKTDMCILVMGRIYALEKKGKPLVSPETEWHR